MKKYLKLDALTKAEVPCELDLRILAAGKLRQGALLQRRRKLRFVFSGAAAAAAFAVALGLCLMPQNQDFRDVQQSGARRCLVCVLHPVIIPRYRS